MALSPGARLGPYEIQSAIGAGGMGEVYRARDARLGRDVAIKVLPDALTLDPDRMARFEREARLLASLNHSNIAAIYGLEEAAGVRGLVLELVEGETLAERLRRGPLPVAQALAIARQLCEALDAAHERGIVHRDLKPANIMLTRDGVAKVLDFGLAKSSAGASRTDQTHAATAVPDGTRAGTVLGTVAYMSPEQARGSDVDKRTDVWAFGCVLYEMLTGQPAYGAATSSDTVVRILDREPDWSLLPPATPPDVQRLLRRCLEKDPKRRLRDIGDARTELQDGTGTETPAAARAGATAAAPARRMAPWAIAAILLVALAAILVVPRLRSPATPSPRVLRSVVVLPEGQQLDRSGGTHPMALSPDGTMLVYSAVAGDRQLFIREMTAFEPRAVAGTTGAIQPFFSPDGKSIAFFAGGSLHKVAVSGGAPLRICPLPLATRGGSWGADDTIVFATVQDRLWRVRASGGTPQPIPNTDRGVWPEILPDGKTVLFTTGPEVATVALDGTNRRVLARTGSERDGIVVGPGGFNGARYVPAGYIVYGRGLRVLAVPFDVQSQTLTGEPMPVSESVFRAQGGGALAFSVSAAGVLAYAPSGGHELVYVSRDGRAAPISADRDAFHTPRLSPDGRRIAVSIFDSESRRADIWVYDADRGMKLRLTTERHNLMPVWTPDGTRVMFNHGERRADGSGTLQSLSKPDNSFPTSWSRDERHLLINNLSREAAAGNGDIWVIANGTPRPLLTTAAAEYHGRFSPDGRWIAYMSNESGRYEVYAIRYPQLDGRVPLSAGGGTNPVWSPDGREIFYRQGLAMMATGFDSSRGVPIDRPRRLFEGPFVGAGGDGAFDVTLLLDTHVFLWWSDDDRRLKAAARDAIAAADRVVISAASAWECAIKISRGRLRLPVPFTTAVERNRFEALPITLAHAERVTTLPHHHANPFDRMLVAQTLIEGLTLVTHDREFEPYGMPVIWA